MDALACLRSSILDALGQCRLDGADIRLQRKLPLKRILIHI